MCCKVVNTVTIVYYIRLESAMIGLDVLVVVVCILLYVNRVKISIYFLRNKFLYIFVTCRGIVQDNNILKEPSGELDVKNIILHKIMCLKHRKVTIQFHNHVLNA